MTSYSKTSLCVLVTVVIKIDIVEDQQRAITPLNAPSRVTSQTIFAAFQFRPTSSTVYFGGSTYRKYLVQCGDKSLQILLILGH